MTNREYRKKLEEDGTPKKLARVLSEAAGEIFVLMRKAAKLERDGNHEAAVAATAEICSWLNGMNGFVEAVAKMLAEDAEE